MIDPSPKKPKSDARKATEARRASVALHERLMPAPVERRRFASLGPVPLNDPLALAAHLYNALGISYQQALDDVELTDRERRAELLKISQTATALMPDAVRKQVDDKLNAKAKHVAADAIGPKMEAATDVQAQSGTSTTSARRGRPRKRGIA